jgi:hypothetical protein
MPIVMLAVQARKPALDRLVFVVWLPVLALVNLGLYGIPKAVFDLPGREAAFAQALGPRGLVVGYAGYPGEPDISMLATPAGATRFNLDIELAAARGDLPRALERLEDQVDAALARGSRVLVFRVIDPADWRGPVLQLALLGATRERLRSHLAARYRIVNVGEVAGFPAWELLPRSGGP